MDLTSTLHLLWPLRPLSLSHSPFNYREETPTGGMWYSLLAVQLSTNLLLFSRVPQGMKHRTTTAVGKYVLSWKIRDGPVQDDPCMQWVCVCHVTCVLLLKWGLRAWVAELTGCSHTLRRTHTNTNTHGRFSWRLSAVITAGEERKGVFAFGRCPALRRTGWNGEWNWDSWRRKRMTQVCSPNKKGENDRGAPFKSMKLFRCCSLSPSSLYHHHHQQHRGGDRRLCFIID